MAKIHFQLPQTQQNALAPVSEGSSTELIPQMLQTLRNNEEYDTGIYFVQVVQQAFFEPCGLRVLTCCRTAISHSRVRDLLCLPPG